MLRALFPGGIGGAKPGRAIPGTAGAPVKGGGSTPPETFPTMGADRSFVTAFLSCLPLLISVRSAPCFSRQLEMPYTWGHTLFAAGPEGLEGRFPGGGGGGGGGPEKL